MDLDFLRCETKALMDWWLVLFPRSESFLTIFLLANGWLQNCLNLLGPAWYAKEHSSFFLEPTYVVVSYERYAYSKKSFLRFVFELLTSYRQIDQFLFYSSRIIRFADTSCIIQTSEK